ncbi:MAG: hypothetical protein WD605_00475 [Candidatus Paceibacterota bacterium]
MQNYNLKYKIMVGGFAAALVTLTTLLPATVLAETVVRTGDSVSIGVNQIVENNLYAAAGNVSLSGEVKEDMYVLAGSVTINGPIGADLTAIGGTVQTHASIGDDFRAVGGDVVIASDVGGDVFVFAGHLRILSSANIAGNVYFYGGEAEIDGVVEGDIMGRADLFFINNSVGGTDFSARRVVLGDQANIKGDLRYKSVYDLERSANATVSGSVLASVEEVDERSSVVPLIMFLMAWLFASLSVMLFFRSGLEKLLTGLKNNPARATLLGLASIVVAPVLSIILMVTVLGSWIGVGLLLLILMLSLISLVMLPLVLGGYLLSFYRKQNRIDIWAALLGMLVVLVLINIPFVGGLAIFLALILTIGAVTHAVYKAVRTYK